MSKHGSITLTLTRYQRELLEEALVDYIATDDTDQEWVEPTQAILNQVKDYAPCTFASDVESPAS